VLQQAAPGATAAESSLVKGGTVIGVMHVESEAWLRAARDGEIASPARAGAASDAEGAGEREGAPPADLAGELGAALVADPLPTAQQEFVLGEVDTASLQQMLDARAVRDSLLRLLVAPSATEASASAFASMSALHPSSRVDLQSIRDLRRRAVLSEHAHILAAGESALSRLVQLLSGQSSEVTQHMLLELQVRAVCSLLGVLCADCAGPSRSQLPFVVVCVLDAVCSAATARASAHDRMYQLCVDALQNMTTSRAMCRALASHVSRLAQHVRRARACLCSRPCVG
jgi:hypothetical protein